MTGTDPIAPTAPARPSTPLRRALGLELRHHRDHLAILGVVAVVLIQLAWHLDLPLGVVAILLAARLPADLADTTPVDGRMLRSSLGIARADAVRARFLVVTGGQLLLAIGAAWAILLTDHAAGTLHWSTLATESEQQLTLGDHLLDIALWSGALAWTHALIGGEASQLDRRPTGRRAVALFLGVTLLQYLVLMVGMSILSLLLTRLGIGGAEAHPLAMAAVIAQALTVTLSLGGGVIALLLGRRRWIRRA